jgi:transposase-like protein
LKKQTQVTPELKQKVVEALKTGMTPAQAVKEFGISAGSAYRWGRAAAPAAPEKKKVILTAPRLALKPVVESPAALSDLEAFTAIYEVLEPMTKPTRSKVLKLVHTAFELFEGDEARPALRPAASHE